MKKGKKKLLGLLGLSAVAVITVIAASISGPEATAITSTDTIEVRVVGNTPAVELSSDVDGKSISFPSFKLDVNYENVTKVTLYKTYLDDGSAPVKIATYDGLDYNAGSVKDAEFTVSKYGKYMITAEAVGRDNVPAPESYVKFDYIPVVASLDINQVTGKYEIKVDSYGSDVYKIEFYLEGEKLETLNNGNFDKLVSFSLAGKPSGTYRVTIVAKNEIDETIYIPLELTINYKDNDVPDAGAPDTGGLFQNLNISKSDYMATGLIIFFAISLVALYLVAKSKKSRTKKN